MSDIITGRAGTPLGDALREIADLRGLLAETVPDPEYRRMQDIEIERLREERKRLREALTAARDFIEDSAFNVLTKYRFDAVLKTIDAALAKEETT